MENVMESVMNMKPYQIVYSENSTSVKYKYYCKDKQSDMINAYYITVILGKDNKVNSPVIEEENDFISEILNKLENLNNNGANTNKFKFQDSCMSFKKLDLFI